MAAASFDLLLGFFEIVAIYPGKIYTKKHAEQIQN